MQLVVEEEKSWKSCLQLEEKDLQDCLYFYLYFSQEQKYIETDPELCSLVTSSTGTKSYCYAVLGSRAVREKSFDICIKIENQDFQDKCLLEFVKLASDSVDSEKKQQACGEIQDLATKAECVTRVAK